MKSRQHKTCVCFSWIWLSSSLAQSIPQVSLNKRTLHASRSFVSRHRSGRGATAAAASKVHHLAHFRALPRCSRQCYPRSVSQVRTHSILETPIQCVFLLLLLLLLSCCWWWWFIARCMKHNVRTWRPLFSKGVDFLVDCDPTSVLSTLCTHVRVVFACMQAPLASSCRLRRARTQTQTKPSDAFA